MTRASVSRYLASGSTALLAAGVGAIGVLHVAAGATTAAVPVLGAVVLAGYAVALAPRSRHRVDHVVPAPDTARGNAGLFLAALGFAAAVLTGFLGLYAVSVVAGVASVVPLVVAQN